MICAVLLVFAAVVGSAQDTSPFKVVPSDTDPAIKEFNAPHLVYFNRTTKPRNELLVFLPGTNGKPGGTNLFCQTAADLGYQVIALAYPTSIPATIVRNEKDPDAFKNFRLEIIEGRDLSTFIQVSRTDSIENRLISALRHLAKTRAVDRWSQYLTEDGQLNWIKIAFSGHSQGGGHAALIGIIHKVSRVIVTGGPKDYDRNLGKPAAWYTKPATPISSFYTFNHELDKQGCDFKEQLEVLHVFGLDATGKSVSVDGVPLPYGNSHILTTNFKGSPTESRKAHSTVIGDGITPKDKDGNPVFKPVWEYMLTGPHPPGTAK